MGSWCPPPRSSAGRRSRPPVCSTTNTCRHPRDVLAALGELARSGELARDVAHTLGVAALSAGIAMILGAALGFAIGFIPMVRRYGMASVDFLRTIPAVALVPVAVLTFGPIPSTEVILATYAALWPIVLHTAAGVAAVHPRQYDVARMLRFGPLTTLRKIVIPAVVPAWLVGARMAAIIAVLVAVVAEMIMYPRGLGGGLIESLHALAPARMWAYALVCGIVGALLNAGLRHGVRLALPGNPVHGGRDQPIPAPPVTALRGLLPIGVALIVWQLSTSDSSCRSLPGRMDQSDLADVRGRAIGSGDNAHPRHIRVRPAVGRRHRGRSGNSDRLFAGGGSLPHSDNRFRCRHSRRGARSGRGPVVRPEPSEWDCGGRPDRVVARIVEHRDGDAVDTTVRLEMSRTMGLSPLHRWTKVILPSLSPGILLGVRVASSMAIIITLLVDILGSGMGIGRLLVESQQRFDAAAAWGLLLIVGAFGYVMSLSLSLLERQISVPQELLSRA